MVELQYIPCTIEAGAFSGECIVSINYGPLSITWVAPIVYCTDQTKTPLRSIARDKSIPGFVAARVSSTGKILRVPSNQDWAPLGIEFGEKDNG